jgi:hypothetical protein
MAFDRTNFAVSENHNSSLPRVCSYTTVDTAAAVDSAGYFNDVADILNVGDVIKANVDTDGTPGYVEFYVSANDGTTVDVNDGVTIVTTTDTD